MVAMQGYLLSSYLFPLVDCAGSGTAAVGMDYEDDDLLGLSEGTVKYVGLYIVAATIASGWLL